MPSSVIRHVRPVVPVDFAPTDPEWDMGETMKHQDLREVARDSLRAAAGEGSTVGSNQFVFLDPRDGDRKCAPDAFVKLGVRQFPIVTWKTWEHGVPELCCEIVSKSDREKQTLEQKLVRFHEMGVREVVAFDHERPPGRRLRAWDLVSGDLVERVIVKEATPCLTLGLWFVVAPAREDGLEAALRLAEDAAGCQLVPTPAEERARERAEKERALAEKERALAEKERALAEVERLRAELAAATGRRKKRR